MGRPKREVKMSVMVTPEPMSGTELAAAERMLTTLIARAYLADHPELSGAQKEMTTSGPPAAAAAVAGAPPASAGGPEELELEHGDNGQRRTRLTPAA